MLVMRLVPPCLSILFFFFNDPAPPEFYPLPLHDALPISLASRFVGQQLHDALRRARTGACLRIGGRRCGAGGTRHSGRVPIKSVRPASVSASRTRSCCSGDRKSTRLNSSHMSISYAVFCLKKKKTTRRYAAKRAREFYDLTQLPPTVTHPTDPAERRRSLETPPRDSRTVSVLFIV